MKHIRTIFLVLLAVLMAAGCSPKQTDTQDATAVPSSIEPAVETTDGWDFDNRFGMNYDKLVETEDAYYYSANDSDFLLYYDKASSEQGVLCAKPDCIHDAGRGDRNCNGLIAQTGASLNLWDGRLHYFAPAGGNCALYSIALDGSDRKMDIEIEDAVVMPGVTPQRLDHHRGKLYGYDTKYIVKNGVPLSSICVFSIDAGTGEYREIFSRDSENSITEPTLFYFQNYMFIGFEEFTVDEENKIDSLTWQLLRWDIDAEEMEKFASADQDEIGNLGMNYRIYTEDGKRFWLAALRNNMAEPPRVYMLENGRVSQVFQFDTTGPCYLTGGVAATVFIFEERCEIRSLDGTLIYEGELDTSFLDALEEGRTFSLASIRGLMGDTESLFLSFNIESDDGGEERICLVRYDLIGGTPVPTVIACTKN